MCIISHHTIGCGRISGSTVELSDPLSLPKQVLCMAIFSRRMGKCMNNIISRPPPSLSPGPSSLTHSLCSFHAPFLSHPLTPRPPFLPHPLTPSLPGLPSSLTPSSLPPCITVQNISCIYNNIYMRNYVRGILIEDHCMLSPSQVQLVKQTYHLVPTFSNSPSFITPVIIGSVLLLGLMAYKFLT